MSGRCLFVTLLWLLCGCHMHLVWQLQGLNLASPPLRWEFKSEEESPPKVDDKLLERPDVANLLKFPRCSRFLLDGLSLNETLKLDKDSIQGWRFGDAFPQADNKNPFFTSRHGNFSENQTRFEVVQTAEWKGWTPSTIPEHLLQAVDGLLTLGSFWSIPTCMRSAYVSSSISPHSLIGTPSDGVSTNLMEHSFLDFVIVVQGLSITRSQDQRLCMLGCATRPYAMLPRKHLTGCDTSGHDSEHADVSRDRSHTLIVKDCDIMVQMKYPKHYTVRNRQIEAELTSLRGVDDPLYFLPVPILGPQIAAESYEFSLETSLDSASNRSTSCGGNADHTSSPCADNLIDYLERSGNSWESSIGLSTEEQHVFKKQGMVQKGPFIAPLLARAEAHSSSPTVSIEVSLRLSRVFCRPITSGTGTVVSGLLESVMYVDKWRGEGVARQKPFAVEGKWDPATGELCMLLCQTSLSDTSSVESFAVNYTHEFIKPADSCNWKLCIHSVLSKHTTLDSPQGLIMSSLLQPHHPKYHPPIKFSLEPAGHTSFTDMLLDSPKQVEVDNYMYTKIPEASKLAELNIAPHFVAFIRRNRLQFPSPDEGDLCSSGQRMMFNFLMVDVSGRKDDGEEVDLYLKLTHFESCRLTEFGATNGSSPEVYDSKANVKVAVSFYVLEHLDTGRYRSRAFRTSHAQNAEGVYDPKVGQMHLIASIQPGSGAIPGPLKSQLVNGSTEEVEDAPVYIQIQYPPLNPTSPHQMNVKLRFESLRSLSDPLYFSPFEMATKGAHMYSNADFLSPSLFQKRDLMGLSKWVEDIDLYVDDIEDLLLRIILVLCIVRQIIYNRENYKSLPYMSQTMLAFQALYQLSRCLLYFPYFEMFFEQLYFAGFAQIFYDDLAVLVKAMALVLAVLLAIPAYQISVAQTQLKETMRLKPTESLKSPPSEWKILILSTILFGFVFTGALASAWVASTYHIRIDAPWLPDSPKMQIGRYFDFTSTWLDVAFDTFAELLREFYLVPQVIANILCDLKGSPLSPSFIIGPTLLYSFQHVYNIYYRVQLGPELSPWNANIPILKFSDLLIVVGDSTVLICIFSLALMVYMQQHWGGRLNSLSPHLDALHPGLEVAGVPLRRIHYSVVALNLVEDTV